VEDVDGDLRRSTEEFALVGHPASSASKWAGSSNGPTRAKVEPLLVEEVLRDVLDVLGGHLVEPLSSSGSSISPSRIASEPVLDRP
jgi:hypothetical protein